MAISITHSTGTAKILFKDLPAATQEIYGYDPARATEYEEQEVQRVAEQKQRAETQRLQAEKENAVKQQARLAKEQTEIAQGQARQQAASQAEQEAKNNRFQTTPLAMILSDPKPRVPFLIKVKVEVATSYGFRAYRDARESHFAFQIFDEKFTHNATGFMRRDKGEAVRNAIASKGGSMTAIIKGIYLPEMFDAGSHGAEREFEILEVIEQ